MSAKFSRLSLAAALLFLLACAGFAALAAQQTSDIAQITGPPYVVLGGRNTSAQAKFTVTVAPGYHIQSNHPKLDYLIPSAIQLTPVAGITVEPAQWPVAKEHKFSFAPDALTVFEGSFPVMVRIKSEGITAGEHVLKGTFRYQACNDQLCRPPVTVPVALTVTVAAMPGH